MSLQEQIIERFASNLGDLSPTDQLIAIDALEQSMKAYPLVSMIDKALLWDQSYMLISNYDVEYNNRKMHSKTNSGAEFYIKSIKKLIKKAKRSES